MKLLIKNSLSAHFAMVFLSFIIFSTNSFTTRFVAINIIASILLIGIYLYLFYTDAFNTTCIFIRNKKKVVCPVITSLILYIIPILLLVWSSISPLYYDVIVSDSGKAPEFQYTESGELSVTEQTKEAAKETVTEKAIRQDAWFNLYMQPYKGLYHITGENIIIKVISLLLMPIVSLLGYINAKRGKDFLRIAENRWRKMVYQHQDDI